MFPATPMMATADKRRVSASSLVCRGVLHTDERQYAAEEIETDSQPSLVVASKQVGSVFDVEEVLCLVEELRKGSSEQEVACPRPPAKTHVRSFAIGPNGR